MMQMNRMVPGTTRSSTRCERFVRRCSRRLAPTSDSSAAVFGKSRDVLGIRSSPALLTPTSLSRNCYRRGRSTPADTAQSLPFACPSLTTRSGKTPHRPANVFAAGHGPALVAVTRAGLAQSRRPPLTRAGQ